MWSEESYLLPRAPSADTQSGRLARKPAVSEAQLGVWQGMSPTYAYGRIKSCFLFLGGVWGGGRDALMRVYGPVSFGGVWGFQHPASSDLLYPGNLALACAFRENQGFLAIGGCSVHNAPPDPQEQVAVFIISVFDTEVKPWGEVFNFLRAKSGSIGRVWVKTGSNKSKRNRHMIKIFLKTHIFD